MGFGFLGLRLQWLREGIVSRVLGFKNRIRVKIGLKIEIGSHSIEPADFSLVTKGEIRISHRGECPHMNPETLKG